MTGLMNAVYQRLLPLPLALHRAWPQAAQPLPGLSFSLLDYEAGEEGQGRVKIRLSLSAVLPEEADALGDEAARALLPLGLRLASARDEAEADTGVFLKTMVFEGLSLGGGFLALDFKLLADGAWLSAEGLLSARFDRAGRVYREIRDLDGGAARFAPGEERRQTLELRFMPLAYDPGQAVLRAAFLAGTAVDWLLEGGAYSQSGRGLVTELGDSALGFSARVMTI